MLTLLQTKQHVISLRSDPTCRDIPRYPKKLVHRFQAEIV